MRVTHLFGFVLVAASVGAWAHFSSVESARNPKQATREQAANESIVPQRAVATERTMPTFRVAQPTSVASPKEVTAAPIEGPVAKPLSPAEKQALIEQVLVEAYPENATLRFDQALEAQPLNPTWNAEVTEAANRLLLNEALRGTQLSSVDCRATLCRMRVTHGDIEAEKAFWHSTFTADGPWAAHLQGGPTRPSGEVLESFVYFANKDGSKQYAQIDAQITEDTELAVTLALEERGESADSG